jgi:hypothetical protein
MLAKPVGANLTAEICTNTKTRDNKNVRAKEILG